ncbi:hypothetical protein [Psychromicrobium xiongbiense]|uniref:hypothetical protein n=1 Tax=Psychromicrobium xiongbiense TaxID=3051184 RepID=UPI0025525D84|nr:hypothetical protein [Psychromicrobium sp. YIM S02556]
MTEVLKHTWDEARAAAFAASEPLALRMLPLDQAAGGELRTDLHAPRPVPDRDTAMMSGWAVNGSGPWIPVIDQNRLFPGQAQQVSADRPVPAATRAVVAADDAVTDLDDDGLPRLRLSERVAPGHPRAGQGLTMPGGEIGADELLVKAGERLEARSIALARLAGASSVLIRPRPTLHVQAGSARVGRIVRDLCAAFGAFEAMDARETALGDLPPVPEPDPADLTIALGEAGRHRTLEAWRDRHPAAGTSVTEVVAAVALAAGSFRLERLETAGVCEDPSAADSASVPLLLTLAEELAPALLGMLLAVPSIYAGLSGASYPEIPQLPVGAALEATEGPSRLLPFREMFGFASPTGAPPKSTRQATAEPGRVAELMRAQGVLVVPPSGARMGQELPVLLFG